MTFEESALNYHWLVGELEQIAKHPDPAVRLDRVAGLFHFYLADVNENQRLASLVAAAIGILSDPCTVSRNGDLESRVSPD